jgi:hypothetical protein
MIFNNYSQEGLTKEWESEEKGEGTPSDKRNVEAEKNKTVAIRVTRRKALSLDFQFSQQKERDEAVDATQREAEICSLAGRTWITFHESQA